MNISEFGTNFVQGSKLLLSKGKFIFLKEEPKILLVLGGIFLVGGTVAACKATLKIEEILNEKDEMEEKISNGVNDPKLSYTEEDAYKDRANLAIKTACKIAKNYIPAVVLEAGAMYCFVKSYGIMNTRLLESFAAYTALDNTFRAYRERVGKEEKDIYYLTGEKSKNLVDVSEKESNIVTLPTEKNYQGPFVFHFNAETSEYFDIPDSRATSPAYNRMFLKQIQNYCNDQLEIRGYLFLNDVLDQLGIRRTPAGALVGWMRKDKTENGLGYIDFNIYDNYRYYAESEGKDGGRRDYVLTMNVDPGVIWDKIV